LEVYVASLAAKDVGDFLPHVLLLHEFHVEPVHVNLVFILNEELLMILRALECERVAHTCLSLVRSLCILGRVLLAPRLLLLDEWLQSFFQLGLKKDPLVLVNVNAVFLEQAERVLFDVLLVVTPEKV